MTEEPLCPVTTALGLASAVQGEGHVYSRDTVWTSSGLSFSSLGYSHPRFTFELVLYHLQTKRCSTLQKGAPNFRLLFLRTIRHFTLNSQVFQISGWCKRGRNLLQNAAAIPLHYCSAHWGLSLWFSSSSRCIVNCSLVHTGSQIKISLMQPQHDKILRDSCWSSTDFPGILLMGSVV